MNCLCLGVRSSKVNGVSGHVGMASEGGGRNQRRSLLTNRKEDEETIQ